jgi:exodeoxyribonuclease V alpha subunit
MNTLIQGNEPFLDRLIREGALSELDVRFGRFAVRLHGSEEPALFWAAALVSRHREEGHICIDLKDQAGKFFPDGAPDAVILPSLAGWQTLLKRSSVVGPPGEYRPLVLDGSRLYLYRYWDYEKRLIDLLKERVTRESPAIDERRLAEGLRRLFPPSETEETDWQKVAASAAVLNRFCVISGGPGTGKTTAVARLLVLLLEQAGPAGLRVALAAPTGKAAARLQEALQKVREGIDCSEAVRAALGREASTLHRLLGSRPGRPDFRYDVDNPLPADVVIVDEASMVDLPLLSKLVQALHVDARLILLGDKDQLASVEAGAALGDLCDTGRDHGYSRGFRETVWRIAGETLPESTEEAGPPGIRDAVVELRKSYRFGGAGGIGRAGRAVNEGNGTLALSLMKEGRGRDLAWRDVPGPEGLARALTGPVLRWLGPCLKVVSSADPGEVFALFNRFRILCALREGPYGVVAVNRLVEEILSSRGLIRKGGRWYTGRPVLVTENDYTLRLFNGDVGIMLPDPQARGGIRAVFPGADGGWRKLLPMRLPGHETVFAMTVHKSQGSEFEDVLLLLPDRPSAVLTRELVYTGITRARHRVEVWGRDEVFRGAVSRRTERVSGLREGLWGR